MNIRTLDHANLKGKTVLLRTDLDVPVDEWQIESEHRLHLATHTIRELLRRKVKKIHIISQFIEKENQSFGLIRDNLSRIIGEKVFFVPAIGDYSGNSKIVLYENFALINQQQRKTKKFVEHMIQKTGANLFIEDTFLFSELTPSVNLIKNHIPCYAGIQLENDLKILMPLIEKKAKINGLCAVVGGRNFDKAKGFLERSAIVAENICLGGAIANTFLKAQKHNVGQSEYDEKHVKDAKRIINLCKKHNTHIEFPTDYTGFNTYKQENFSCGYPSIMDEYVIQDIGSKTISKFRNILRSSKMVTWHGPLGTCRDEASSSGTRAMTEFLANDYKGKTIIGGEDTVRLARKYGFEQKYDTQNASLGGTAMLDFLCGKPIPAVEFFMLGWVEKKRIKYGPKIKRFIIIFTLTGLAVFVFKFWFLIKIYLGLAEPPRPRPRPSLPVPSETIDPIAQQRTQIPTTQPQTP